MIDNIFLFKQKSQDFIVEEQLPFKLSGKWDAFFVYFEKRNLNTMDIIDFLCKEFGFSRLTLWIAGLKDKKAITRQRISIYKSALSRIGGHIVFMNTLAEKVRIIKYDWHDKPIGMTTPINNVFYIRLRATKKLWVQDKKDTYEYLKDLASRWFPNFYGDQRFWIEWKNWKQWRDIISGKLALKDKKEIGFKLQAYASKLFNLYITSREKQDYRMLDGDVLEIHTDGKKEYWIYHKDKNTVSVIDLYELEWTNSKDVFFYPKNFIREIPYVRSKMLVTWPVLGYNLLMWPKWSESEKNEIWFLDYHSNCEKHMQVMKANKIFGLRRPLWVYLSDVEFRFQEDDVLLQFALPSGSYASVFIDKILDKLVERKTEK